MTTRAFRACYRTPGPTDGNAMTALLIAYDLNSPGHRQEQLLTLIKKEFPWAKLSESSYAVVTMRPPAPVFDLLKPLLGKSDQLLVIALSRRHRGVGSEPVVDWLDKLL